MALKGDLGSGKTEFTKGLAKAFRIREEITSPTFVLMKEYSISNSFVKKLIHIDLYRINSIEDAETIGIEEILADTEAVVVIEWPEKIKPLLPKKTIWINFNYMDENRREIEVIK